MAKLHQYVANSRKDLQHKISRTLVNENQITIWETLNIAGMMKGNSKLAKAFGDAGIAEIMRQTDYKADWADKISFHISRWFASSKTCNGCKFIIEELPLSCREWDCPNCKRHNHRDANAAENIEEEGIRCLEELGLIEIIAEGSKNLPREFCSAKKCGAGYCVALKTKTCGLP